MSPLPAEDFDAVVVGGGLGGLLAAAVVARGGGRALVLERLPRVGGRFTTSSNNGYEITTGALHLVPHGQGGILAGVMRELGLEPPFVPRELLGTVLHNGRHFVLRRKRDVARLVDWKGKLELARIFARFRLQTQASADTSFADWLDQRTRNPVIKRMFECFSHFALSISADQIAYTEMRAVMRNVFRFGLPEIPVGGCRSVVESLAGFVRRRGGAVLTGAKVLEILQDGPDGRACGVRLRSNGDGQEQTVRAPLVISDVGPGGTAPLLNGSGARVAPPANGQPAASGFKVHLASDKSLIPHNSILFCLDTQRICGMVQVTNAVPSLAPPGTHLIDTFQVPQSSDMVEEKRMALEDLRQVFGADFERHCRVIGTSAYRGPWPVNRVVQGQDASEQEPVPGLIMVGDAYKPSGQMMVEGVAGSVRRVAARLARRG